MKFEYLGVKMRETGIIVSANGDKVRVRVMRGEACDGCHLCDSLGADSALMQVEARNAIGAKVGDTVDVEVAPRHIIGYTSILFIFPVIMMIVGYIVAMKYFAGGAAKGEGLGILGSFIGLGVSFGIIRLIDFFFAQKHESVARVIRRVSSGGKVFINPPTV